MFRQRLKEDHKLSHPKKSKSPPANIANLQNQSWNWDVGTDANLVQSTSSTNETYVQPGNEFLDNYPIQTRNICDQNYKKFSQLNLLTKTTSNEMPIKTDIETKQKNKFAQPKLKNKTNYQNNPESEVSKQLINEDNKNAGDWNWKDNSEWESCNTDANSNIKKYFQHQSNQQNSFSFGHNKNEMHQAPNQQQFLGFQHPNIEQENASKEGASNVKPFGSGNYFNNFKQEDPNWNENWLNWQNETSDEIPVTATESPPPELIPPAKEPVECGSQTLNLDQISANDPNVESSKSPENFDDYKKKFSVPVSQEQYHCDTSLDELVEVENNKAQNVKKYFNVDQSKIKFNPTEIYENAKTSKQETFKDSNVEITSSSKIDRYESIQNKDDFNLKAKDSVHENHPCSEQIDKSKAQELSSQYEHLVPVDKNVPEISNYFKQKESRKQSVEKTRGNFCHKQGLGVTSSTQSLIIDKNIPLNVEPQPQLSVIAESNMNENFQTEKKSESLRANEELFKETSENLQTFNTENFSNCPVDRLSIGVDSNISSHLNLYEKTEVENVCSEISKENIEYENIENATKILDGEAKHTVPPNAHIFNEPNEPSIPKIQTLDSFNANITSSPKVLDLSCRVINSNCKTNLQANKPNFSRMVLGESSKDASNAQVSQQFNQPPAMPSGRVVTGNDYPQPVYQSVRSRNQVADIRGPPDGPYSVNESHSTSRNLISNQNKNVQEFDSDPGPISNRAGPEGPEASKHDQTLLIRKIPDLNFNRQSKKDSGPTSNRRGPDGPEENSTVMNRNGLDGRSSTPTEQNMSSKSDVQTDESSNSRNIISSTHAENLTGFVPPIRSETIGSEIYNPPSKLQHSEVDTDYYDKKPRRKDYYEEYSYGKEIYPVKEYNQPSRKEYDSDHQREQYRNRKSNKKDLETRNRDSKHRHYERSRNYDSDSDGEIYSKEYRRHGNGQDRIMAEYDNRRHRRFYDEERYNDRSQPMSRSSSYGNITDQNELQREIYLERRETRKKEDRRQYRKRMDSERDRYSSYGGYDHYGNRSRDHVDPYYNFYQKYMEQQEYYRQYYGRYGFPQGYPPNSGFPPGALDSEDKGSTRSGRSSVIDDAKKSSVGSVTPYDPYSYYYGQHAERLSQNQAQRSLTGAITPHSQSSVFKESGELNGAPSITADITAHLFSEPHLKASFNPGGRLLLVLPNHPAAGERAIVQQRNVRKMLAADGEFQKRIEAYEAYPGPLIGHETHKEVVIRYCEDLTKNLDGCDYSKDKDIDSLVLVWEYLTLLVKQNGLVTGADFANLLVNASKRKESRGRTFTGAFVVDRNISCIAKDTQNILRKDSNSSIYSEKSNDFNISDHSFLASSQPKTDSISRNAEKRADEELMNRFKEFLYVGRKKEAVDFAVKNHLWGPANFLASKMDSLTLARVTSAFLSVFPSNDEIHTLDQHLSRKKPEICKNFSNKKYSDWYRHLALMISNPTGDLEKDKISIAALGDSLRGGDSKGVYAAHVCYLAANLPFECYPGLSSDVDSKNHSRLVLIGSDSKLDFRNFASDDAIRCTEIYEYAKALGFQSQGGSSGGFQGQSGSSGGVQAQGGNSFWMVPHFQSYKFIYALRLTECGFYTEALKYCEVISESICQNFSVFSSHFAAQVIDLSQMLKYHDPHYQLGQGELSEMDDPEWLQRLENVKQHILYQEQIELAQKAPQDQVQNLHEATEIKSEEQNQYQSLQDYSQYGNYGANTQYQASEQQFHSLQENQGCHGSKNGGFEQGKPTEDMGPVLDNVETNVPVIPTGSCLLPSNDVGNFQVQRQPQVDNLNNQEKPATSWHQPQTTWQSSPNFPTQPNSPENYGDCTEPQASYNQPFTISYNNQKVNQSPDNVDKNFRDIDQNSGLPNQSQPYFDPNSPVQMFNPIIEQSNMSQGVASSNNMGSMPIPYSQQESNNMGTMPVLHSPQESYNNMGAMPVPHSSQQSYNSMGAVSFPHIPQESPYEAHEPVKTTANETGMKSEEEEQYWAMMAGKTPETASAEITKPQPENANKKKDDDNKKNESGGKKKSFLGSLFGWNKSDQAILPDDKNPSIIWDEEKKRWINTDADDVDETPLAPPPSDANRPGTAPPVQLKTLKSAKTTRSRYVDPVSSESRSKSTSSAMLPPLPQPPTGFSLIQTQPPLPQAPSAPLLQTQSALPQPYGAPVLAQAQTLRPMTQPSIPEHPQQPIEISTQNMGGLQEAPMMPQRRTSQDRRASESSSIDIADEMDQTSTTNQVGYQSQPLFLNPNNFRQSAGSATAGGVPDPKKLVGPARHANKLGR